MLFDFLSQYLGDVEAAVRKLKGVYVERYEEEIVAANRVNLRIRVRFLSGYMLEVKSSPLLQMKKIKQQEYQMLRPDLSGAPACPAVV